MDIYKAPPQASFCSSGPAASSPENCHQDFASQCRRSAGAVLKPRLSVSNVLWRVSTRSLYCALYWIQLKKCDGVLEIETF